MVWTPWEEGVRFSGDSLGRGVGCSGDSLGRGGRVWWRFLGKRG